MGETRREGERKRTLAVGADEPEQHRASRPPLLRQEPIWSPKMLHASSLGLGSTQGGGQPLLEAAGIEPVSKAIENPKQDVLLPAIALILLGFVIPSRPVSSRSIPRWRGTLGAHAAQQGQSAWTQAA